MQGLGGGSYGHTGIFFREKQGQTLSLTNSLTFVKCTRIMRPRSNHRGKTGPKGQCSITLSIQSSIKAVNARDVYKEVFETKEEKTKSLKRWKLGGSKKRQIAKA